MKELIWIIAITSICNMTCFLIGAYVTFDNKKVKTKTINPLKIYKEHKVNKQVQYEIDKETEKEKIINENIDNYNGTSLGQRDIPR